MKRIGFAAVALVFASGLAFAMQDPAQQLQQNAAAAKEAAARNQQALRSYSWVTKTELSLKGEVKNTKIESCKYGPDGKVEKTLLTDPPEPPKRQRGLKGRVVAKKVGEMKEELETAATLAHSYVPPSAEKIQAVIAAGGVSISQAGPGQIAVSFANYEKSGDSMTLTLESATKSLRHLKVDTWLEAPDEPVTLDVSFKALPDASYAAATLLKIPESQIEVRIENSNYQKLAP